MDLYTRALIIWVLIAFLEMFHGILLARLLAPRTGDLLSRQIGVFTGSLIFFIVAYQSFDWIGITSSHQAFEVGFIWLFCMLAFEFLIGHFVFHFSWKWLLNDFNLFKGRLLAFGMIFLALCPYLVGYLRKVW